MSADAKVWMDKTGGWLAWCGLHDGDCTSTIPHDQPQDLLDILTDIEGCMGGNMRWEIRVYPDGQTGLVGWTW